MTKPEPSPVSIEAEQWDWQWSLVGNETPSEIAKLNEMLDAAKVFVSALVAGKEPRWLTFLGNPGCGKTHLAERIRAFLLKNGPKFYNLHSGRDESNYLTCYGYAQEGPMLAKWGSVIDKARDGDYGPYKLTAGDFYKVVDDLGVNSLDATGKATSFATQKMSELLDRRLSKWTVITSNFTRSDLAATFDPRISSRLIRGESVIVDCTGVRDYGLRREAMRKAA